MGWFPIHNAQRRAALYASFFFPSFLFVTKEKFQVGDPRITLIKSLETISIGSPTLETYIFDIDESKISTQLSLSLSCRVQN
jgi:hypothetical protein